MVFVQNHTKGPFDPKWGVYQVVAVRGNQVEIRPSVGGHTEMKHVKHVKYIPPADRYINQIPDYTVFGRKTTLKLNPNKIPNLHRSLADSYHTTNIGLAISSTITMSAKYVDVSTLSCTKGDKCKEWCGVSLNTDGNILQVNMRPIVCHSIGCTKDSHEKYLTRN